MLDPIPTSLTKECLSDLLPLITRIENSSLCSGVVPPQFKQAVVTPMLKKTGLDQNDEEFSTRVKSALHLHNPRKGSFNTAAETSIRK